MESITAKKAPPRPYASIQERIIANSVLSDEHFHNGTPCWEWTGRLSYGNRSPAGYPVMNMRFKSGPRKGKVRCVRVHRVVVQVFNHRRLTARMVVLHLCNNTNCVNPEHVLGGSQKKNVRQCVAEGRHYTPFRSEQRACA